MNAKVPTVNEAIILAGGLGSRLRPLVSDRPKPMALIAGRPFLEYQFDYLHRQGIQHMVVSVGYMKEMIIDHFGSDYRGIAIDYAIEEKALGTGGGLILALQYCNNTHTVLALNGDTWFPLSVADFAKAHALSKTDFAMALRTMPEQTPGQTANTKRYGGIVLDDKQRIANFSSSNLQNGRYINGGSYLLTSHTQQAWLERFGGSATKALSLEKDLIEQELNTSLYGFGWITETEFIDIGLPEDYSRAASVISSSASP